jgi:uncharacterized protein (TIGR03435 family)
VPEMLQALLKTSFEMKAHHESKDFPVYALAVANGGPKLKASEPDPNDTTAPASTDVSAAGSGQGVSLNFGHGSAFTFSDNKLEAHKLTMARFAEVLARFVDRPVVDQTGLTGMYDFTIELTPDDYRAMLIQSAVSAGVRLPPQALELLNGAHNDSLYSALRKMGLTMAPTKAPLDVIVVDHIAKSPVEN